MVQTTWQVENKVTIENVFRLYRMRLQKMLIVKPQDKGVNDLSDNVAICYKHSDLLRLRIEFWAALKRENECHEFACCNLPALGCFLFTKFKIS